MTTPAGFRAAGVACGLKASGALDLGILACDGPATSAMVDTRTPCRLRPWCATAASTGRPCGPSWSTPAPRTPPPAPPAWTTPTPWRAGRRPAWACCPSRWRCAAPARSATASDLGLAGPGIDAAAAALGADGGPDFGRAICTTDRAPKGGAFRLALGGGEVLIGAAAKGAGMISPKMATMLAYVTVGAAVEAADLRR